MKLAATLKQAATSVLLLLCSTLLPAQQVSIFAEDGTYSTADTIRVNIVGVGLDSMVAADFSLGWDTLVLEFQGIDNVDTQLEDNFLMPLDFTQLDSGRVGLQFFDFGIQPLVTTDTTTMFSAKFTSRVNTNTTTVLNFSDQPLPPVFSTIRGVEATFARSSGTITLEQSTSIPIYTQDLRLRVSPNPITDRSTLQVTLDYPSQSDLEIIDMGGRAVWKQTLNLLAQENRLALRTEMFPTKGTYLIRLTTDREQIVRKVVR